MTTHDIIVDMKTNEQHNIDLSEAHMLSLINLVDALEDYGFTIAPLAFTSV